MMNATAITIIIIFQIRSFRSRLDLFTCWRSNVAAEMDLLLFDMSHLTARARWLCIRVRTINGTAMANEIRAMI
jgi:hypothetical protein